MDGTKMHVAATAVSLTALAVTGGFYANAAPVMIAAGIVTAVVVLPWAVRAGFRYGARRGVEAAIEAMEPQN